MVRMAAFANHMAGPYIVPRTALRCAMLDGVVPLVKVDTLSFDPRRIDGAERNIPDVPRSVCG